MMRPRRPSSTLVCTSVLLVDMNMTAPKPATARPAPIGTTCAGHRDHQRADAQQPHAAEDLQARRDLGRAAGHDQRAGDGADAEQRHQQSILPFAQVQQVLRDGRHQRLAGPAEHAHQAQQQHQHADAPVVADLAEPFQQVLPVAAVRRGAARQGSSVSVINVPITAR